MDLKAIESGKRKRKQADGNKKRKLLNRFFLAWLRKRENFISYETSFFKMYNLSEDANQAQH